MIGVGRSAFTSIRGGTAALSAGLAQIRLSVLKMSQKQVRTNGSCLGLHTRVHVRFSMEGGGRDERKAVDEAARLHLLPVWRKMGWSGLEMRGKEGRANKARLWQELCGIGSRGVHSIERSA